MPPQYADLPGIPQPGEILLGKYRVEHVLGIGGMGVVLAAWHLVLERRIAIKLLLPAAAELPDAGPRFLREARAAAALEGENIARVVDVGTLETGATYMVLEYLTGSDLDEVIRSRGPLPLTEAVDYLLQACEGLAEAHARGIIHRDLKPKNLFLTRRPDGTPLLKVLDFGLSKMHVSGEVEDVNLTATGLIMGSAHYMSPEQIRSLKYADVRTDLWALGVILYRLLTGRYPFDGDSFTAVTAAVLVDTPPGICTFRPDIPEAIDSLVSRCLQKNPALRVQSVTEIARLLVPFGAPRAMRSFESISRLLPEPTASAETTVRAPSSPAMGRPEAASIAPSSPSASLSLGAAVMAGPQATTQPHASWGDTSRSQPQRTRLVVVASAAGLLAMAAVVSAWLFLRRPPAHADVSAAVPSITEPQPIVTAPVESTPAILVGGTAAPPAALSAASTVAASEAPTGGRAQAGASTAAPGVAPRALPTPSSRSSAPPAASYPKAPSGAPPKPKDKDLGNKWD